MENQKKFEKFVEIIELLRSEKGCPWDREQTFKSLKPCIMEEAAEVVAAIRIYDTTNNYENLREELGDLLLQVVMQSQIAKEKGLFTIEDVICEVSEKMIRRHPHVFGNLTVNKTEEVLKNWEEIKKEEKKEKKWIESPLMEIPIELPSLVRGTKVLKKINSLYEPCISGRESIKIIKKDVEKMDEEAMDKDATSKLLGEMLLQICNIAREQKIMLEQALVEEIEKKIDKYERKMCTNGLKD